MEGVLPDAAGDLLRRAVELQASDVGLLPDAVAVREEPGALATPSATPAPTSPTAYIGALDTMLIYESNGVPSISSLAQWSAYAPSNFGVIPYATRR